MYSVARMFLLRQSLVMILLVVVVVLPCALLAFAPSPRNSVPTRRLIRESRSSRAPTTITTLFSTTSTAAEEEKEGLTKTVSKAGNGQPVQLGDIATIKYSCYTSDDAGDDSCSSSLIAKSSSQKMVVGDNTMMIPGLDRAVRSMQIGERSMVRVSSDLAYGAAGVPPIVPPNAALVMDLEVLDAVPVGTTNIDFDALANADSTPRTAADIAAAYSKRQAAAAAANKQELQGLDAWLAKAKNFYFYGLFEGETGERPPWFLRPSITFPLAFLIVGAAFYISYVSGAITERGAQGTDELDEIILSSTTATTTSNVAAALGVVVTALSTASIDLPL